MSGGIGGGSSPVTAGGAGGQINPSTGASNPGQTPTGQPSRGGGGGGGSAGGGAGGAGQTTMTAGASGNMPITQQGGSGGAGGTDGAILAVSSGSNSANETGGNGTAGQPGTAPRNSSTGAPGQDDIGGGGGEGGYGVILTGSGTSGANAAFSNTGTVTGGKGGNGGFDTSGSANAVSGEGGDGGIAIDVLGTGVALMNTAALRGGNAGAGEVFSFNGSGGANNGDGTVFALTSQANQPTAVVTAPPVTITAPASGSTTNLIDPTIAGTAAAGSTIALTSGGTSLGSTTVDGNWSDAVTFGADGTYTVTATDTANGQAAGSASDTFTINSTPNENLFGAITHDVTSPGGDVYALYQTILGRAPDALGLEADVAALGGGTPLATIAQDQLSSPEYTADYGSSTQSTNDAFVGQLYQDGLHRTASASELTFWDNQLADGLTRAQVGVDIATSQESQNDLAPTFQAGVFVPSATDSSIARLYYGLLDRAPDAAGLQGWEGALANGTSLTQVAQAFLGSAEYQAGTVGQGNAQYVQGLYQSALGRAAEPNGLQAFAGGLDTGTLTRAAVADDILTSNEFQGDQAGQTNSAYVNAVYEAALGRPADQAGLQGWDNALASGTSRASVAQDIVGSAEFQQNVTTPGQAAFVNALYQGALGGNADAGGLQANENALNGGATLASVALGVTQGAQAPGHLAPKIEIGFHIS